MKGFALFAKKAIAVLFAGTLWSTTCAWSYPAENYTDFHSARDGWLSPRLATAVQTFADDYAKSILSIVNNDGTIDIVQLSPESLATRQVARNPGDISSLANFMQARFGNIAGGISFVDIGAGPRGEFGQNLLELFKKLGIPVKRGISIDNAMVDQQAVREGKVYYADVQFEEDRARAGLSNGEFEMVSVNNITNPGIIPDAAALVKEQGVLMITFAETDQTDAPHIIEHSMEYLKEISDKSTEHEFRLIGERGTVIRPKDYPGSNSRERNQYASQEHMIVAIKILKNFPRLTVDEVNVSLQRIPEQSI